MFVSQSQLEKIFLYPFICFFVDMINYCDWYLIAQTWFTSSERQKHQHWIASHFKHQLVRFLLYSKQCYIDKLTKLLCHRHMKFTCFDIGQNNVKKKKKTPQFKQAQLEEIATVFAAACCISDTMKYTVPAVHWFIIQCEGMVCINWLMSA